LRQGWRADMSEQRIGGQELKESATVRDPIKLKQ
jgi:hypothetical protein